MSPTRLHPSSPATIRDVARLANTSKTTVSRFLNGQPVKKKTEEALLKAIAELNYHPNASARKLATSQTRNIGIVVDDIRSNFITAVLGGIESVTSGHDYHCLFYSRKGSGQRESEYLNLLYEGQLDGLILISFYDRGDDELERLRSVSDAIVMIGEVPDGQPIVSVDVDNHLGIYDMVDYLRQVGHKGIAFITGPDGSPASRLRTDAYRQAVEDFGLVDRPDWLVSGDWSYESGYLAMTELLGSDRKGFTAVAAANDQMAIGAMRAAQERGYLIPQDFSVTGFDDLEVSEWVYPALSTVRQPYEEMGRLAAEHLYNLLKGSRPEQTRTMLRPKITLRGSSRAPLAERDAAAGQRQTGGSSVPHPES